MADPETPFDNTTPPPSPAATPPAGAPGMLSAQTPDDKTMGMLAHLLVIFTGFIGPLIIWLVKKDQSAFVNQQGKEALNWALTILTAVVACVVLAFIPFINLTLCVIWPGIAVCNIVFGILSTIKVNSGQPYRYPICIRYIG